MILAVVQARMGSQRLPGKSLLPFGNSTVLGYLLRRIKRSQLIDKTVVATSKLPIDDAIQAEAILHGCEVYRGSAENVLARYYGAASRDNAEVIVRLTADDPFKCKDIIDAAIEMRDREKLDYVSNTIKPTYPEGFDVEVFKYSALQRAFENATIERHLEHVTPYIYEKVENFTTGNLINNFDCSNWRMTIDYMSDYEALFELARNVDENITSKDLIDLVVKKNLKAITEPRVERNAGYKRQLNAKN